MRSLSIIGIVLVVAGIAALVLPYIPFTTQEEVIDVGPLRASAERERTIDIHPLIGFGILVIGAGLLVVDRLKR